MSASEQIYPGHPDYVWENQTAQLLWVLARECHNGAGDPYQAFYDKGYAPMLEDMAREIERWEIYHSVRVKTILSTLTPEEEQP